MNNTAATVARQVARTNRTKRTPVKAFTVGERVADRTGKTGVVVERHSRTQALVSYDNGTTVVMYDSSLHITQN